MLKTDYAILIIGDGDFSYSVQLLSKYHGICLTATVMLSEEELTQTYNEAVKNNIAKLTKSNARILFSIDGTALSGEVCETLYDSIHFNFPHTGGKGKISENKLLLRKMFKQFPNILKHDGNVEISLLPGQGGTPADGSKIRYKGNHWNIQDAAAESGFVLHRVEEFETKCYNLTGYRSSSKSFRCDNGLRHMFVHQPFVPSSLTNLLQSLGTDSYLGKYLSETNVDKATLCVNAQNFIGGFDDLISIESVGYSDADELDTGFISKKPKTVLHGDFDSRVMLEYDLKNKKSIFYSADKEMVLYRTYFTHGVSVWSTNEATPNIISTLLNCVGLALHSVTKKEKEPYLDTSTMLYSHCFTVTYSHPYEALSEEFVKHLAHGTVRDNLAKDGFQLH